MHTSVRPYVTTGIALVAAGTLIVAPITAPPNEVVRPVQMAAQAVVHTATASRLLQEALSLTGSGVAGALSDATAIDAATPVGATGTLQVLLEALQQSGMNVLDFLEAAPGTLDNLAQAVIADPASLPNAFSSVLYDLFAIPGLALGGQTNPYLSEITNVPVVGSLLGAILRPIVFALEDVLPAPLGGTTGLVADAGAALSAVVDGLLSLLPAPLQRLNTFSAAAATTTAASTAAVVRPARKTVSAVSDVAAGALTPAAPVGQPLPVAHQVLRSTVQVGRAVISAPGTVAVTAGTDRASLTESGSHHSVRLAAASPNRAAPAALAGGRHRAAH